jgi:hypothetical protein
MSDPIADALQARAAQGAAPTPDGAASAPTDDPIAAALQQRANGQLQAPPQATGPTWGDYGREAARQVGLTVRAGAKGIAAIPGMFSDAATGLYNTGADLIEGRGNGFRFMPAQAALDDTLNRVGLPQPANAQERVVQDAAAAMAGAGSTAGAAKFLANNAASPAAQALAKALATRPALQAVSAGTGAAASGTAREMGASPGVQWIAGFGGTMIPVAGSSLGGALLAKALGATPSNAQYMTDQLDNFGATGATPTVGQATGARLPQAIESTLAKTPGGAGVMAAKGADTLSQTGNTVNAMADSLSPTSGPVEAGNAIKQGMVGDQPDSFVNLFKTQSQRLYNKLDQYLPASSKIDVSNTKTALDSLTADIQGAPALSDMLRNSKIAGIRDAFTSDTGGQQGATPQLTYSAVKQLRSMIGEKLADGLYPTDDLSRRQLGALYGALSTDMEAAANNAGPQAANAYSTANGFFKAGMDKLDLVSNALSSDIPERVYAAATSGAKTGPTVISTIMDGLPPAAQRTVTATFLKNLGQAAPSQQNATGDAFSLESFLTRWNALNPDAKAAIFRRAGYPADFADNLDKIAAVASNIRSGSKVFANPSGTAGSTAAIGIGAGGASSALTALLAGHPGAAVGTAAATAAVPVTANVFAKWMTNPDTVRMLAQMANQPVSRLPAAISALNQVTAQSAAQAPQSAASAPRTGTDRRAMLQRQIDALSPIAAQ